VGEIADALPASGAAGVAGTRGSDALAGSEALGQLQRGELSLPQYLDVTVQHAVQHLEGKLSSEQLGFVRSELRRQLETDPTLQELVRRTTGQLPGSASDE
jgi:hypothetical protein